MDGKLEKVCFGHGKSEGKNGYMLDGHQVGEQSGNIAEGWECMKVGNFMGKLWDTFGSSIKNYWKVLDTHRKLMNGFIGVQHCFDLWTCIGKLGKKVEMLLIRTLLDVPK